LRGCKGNDFGEIKKGCFFDLPSCPAFLYFCFSGYPFYDTAL